MTDGRSPTLILNVDDNEAALYAKTRILRRAGLEVIEAATGVDALRLVAERRPVLLVLDVKLPDISGLEVCRRVKDDHPDILVLQISASFVAGDDRVRGLEGGADSYLTQPIAPNELVATVRALLRIRTAELALRSSEAHLQGVLASATDYAIIRLDEDGLVTGWNTGAMAVFGWKEAEVVGKSLDFIFTEEDQAAGVPAMELRKARETGRAEDKRWHVRRDGSRLYGNGVMTTLANTPGFVKILRDQTQQRLAEEALETLNATLEARVAERTQELEDANQRLQNEMQERARTEERLRQSQKMEAVGQLTGGVAHDFNNMLQVIVGNLEMIIRGLPADAARLRRAADHAMQGCKRAATLTQRLLAFSRQRPLAPRPVNINELVSGMSDLLHRSLGETIQVKLARAPDLWLTEVDANELENAILNLAVNSRDAMPAGGHLTITTANTRLDEPSVRHSEASPGSYVMIAVTDTGAGMDAETTARAFEPFFTTKEIGRGTGLGLSMVYGFVRQSGGHITIDSEEGVGTTIKLYLPRLVGAVSEDQAPESPPVSGGTHETTILLVEDDADVRTYSANVVRELGYRVVEAPDGASALRLIEHGGGPPIRLLFTDVVLPGGMSGEELAEKARALQPDLRVLFTTGYARDAFVQQGRPRLGVRMVSKPFTYADLAAKIREALDGAGHD
jgi:PAS domain S-box-containing protein